MFESRNLIIGAVVFCLTFLVGWMLGLGRATPAASVAKFFASHSAASPGAAPIQVAAAGPFGAAALEAPQRISEIDAAPARLVAVPAPLVPNTAVAPPAPKPQGKGLTDNDGLRQAVILRAKAHERPVCNIDSKTLYVTAATKYAEVLMRSAGCNNFPKCPMGEGNLTDVWMLNRSAADVAVGEAMAALHGLGGLSEKDFRGDVGRAVRVIAGEDFHSGSGPACAQPGSRTGRWRIRVSR